MRIAIPTILSTKQLVGVAEYLRNLIENAQILDSENEYFIITFSQNRHFFDIHKKNFHEIVVPIFDYSRVYLRINYFLWQTLMFNNIVHKNGIDIIHFPCPWLIPKNIKSLATIHDLVEIKLNKYGQLNNYFKKKMIESTVRNSNVLISVSRSTQNDLQILFDKDSHLIENGISKNDNSAHSNKTSEVLNKYRLKKGRYFIFVGTLLKHKNILNQVKAFKLFDKNKNEMKFVIVGKKDNATREIKNSIKKWNLEGKIILTGYIEDNVKDILVKNSVCLMYVSKYEGFGFPILDAQKLSVPVITSNISSMPETAGKGALLVNPTDINQIAKSMEDIVLNTKLRDELINKGLDNIKRFSWKRSTELTIELYQSLYNNQVNF
jgi:glycosyltransferase involved in cell wall biosynthesis